MRYAHVRQRDGIPSAETVARYLPSNYEVIPGEPGVITIGGNDNAGWTLDEYVIPRLMSGLIRAEEVLLFRIYAGQGGDPREAAFPDADTMVDAYPDLVAAEAFHPQRQQWEQIDSLVAEIKAARRN
jgi:hypothetical protein